MKEESNMKLEIENVLGHGYFEAEFEPGVTLVTGHNASGKTSLMLCLAALATHNANPANISGVAKKTTFAMGARPVRRVWADASGSLAKRWQRR